MCDIPLRTMQNNTLSRAADGFPDGGIGPRPRQDERHRAGPLRPLNPNVAFIATLEKT
jgi:hypothetical protein